MRESISRTASRFFVVYVLFTLTDEVPPTQKPRPEQGPGGVKSFQNRNITESYSFQKYFYIKREEILDRALKRGYNTILHQYAQ